MSVSLSTCLHRSGGRVLFNVANDSPTLTGAKVTFTIDLEFPHNQKVLPSGEVVWAEDCTINGKTHIHSNTLLCSLCEPFILLSLYFRLQITTTINWPQPHQAAGSIVSTAICCCLFVVCLFIQTTAIFIPRNKVPCVWASLPLQGHWLGGWVSWWGAN